MTERLYKFWNSLQIQFVFLRFLSSSLVAFAVDLATFSLCYSYLQNIFWSMVAGRIVSGVVNFTMTKKLAFKSQAPIIGELLRFVALVAALMGVSYGLIFLFRDTFGWNTYVAKIIAEVTLFLLSFLLQSTVVFGKGYEYAVDVKTDWDTYYNRPAKMASVTRKITTNLLIRLLRTSARANAGEQALNLVEMGGANSCFFLKIQSELAPKVYTIIDSNRVGLDAFHKSYGRRDNVKLIEADILKMNGKAAKDADCCFSVGLVEHFDIPRTKRAIEAHFEVVRPGGTVIISFPTPTIPYKIIRSAAELLGIWAFPDERPLTVKEVLEVMQAAGKIESVSMNWWIGLTQAVIVARKPGA